MEPHTSTDAPPTRKRASLMVATLMLVGGVASLTAVAAADALPAPAETTTSSPSPTDTASPGPSPTASAQPSPTATATTTSPPSTNCAVDTMVLFEGNLYCPGEIAGVEAGAYGLNSRVVLSVTVTGVNGDLVYIIGGPSCWVDPSASDRTGS